MEKKPRTFLQESAALKAKMVAAADAMEKNATILYQRGHITWTDIQDIRVIAIHARNSAAILHKDHKHVEARRKARLLDEAVTNVSHDC